MRTSRIAALHRLDCVEREFRRPSAHFRCDDGAVRAQVGVIGGDLARRADDVRDACECDDDGN